MMTVFVKQFYTFSLILIERQVSVRKKNISETYTELRLPVICGLGPRHTQSDVHFCTCYVHHSVTERYKTAILLTFEYQINCLSCLHKPFFISND